jgi:hypothetical protein
MSAIGIVLGGFVILVLALAFGWIFFEVVIGLAVALAALIAVIFIAIIVAAGVGLVKALAR